VSARRLAIASGVTSIDSRTANNTSRRIMVSSVRLAGRG
jgi:hypothetical protein